MKKTVKILVSVFIICAMCLSLCACNKKSEKDPWESAVYTEDTKIGKGEKTINVEVQAQEKSVTFEIKTDKKTLGDALIEHDLISGEKGAYGLYVKVVNGIVADYDIDKSYWALTKEKESVMTGVDGVEISDGEHYELVYTK